MNFKRLQRIIGKWFISRSMDDSTSTPSWLRRWIEYDIELQEFELRSQQLSQRLAEDKASWIESHQRPHAPHTIQSVSSDLVTDQRYAVGRQFRTPHRALSRSTLWIATFSLAATMLFVTALLRSSFPDSHQVALSQTQQEETSNQTTTIDSNQQMLGAVLRTGRSWSQKLKNEALPFTEKTKTSVVQIIQGNRMNSELAAGCEFLVKKLPESFCKLIGMEHWTES